MAMVSLGLEGRRACFAFDCRHPLVRSDLDASIPGLRCQLVGNSAHPVGRQYGGRTREHPKRELEHRTRSRETPVEGDPAVERLEKPLDGALGEATRFQTLSNRRLRAAKPLCLRGVGELASELECANPIFERHLGTQQRPERGPWISKRVCDHAPVVRSADDGSTRNFLELEFLVVEFALGRRIATKQHLKAAIEDVAILVDRANAATDRLLCLEQSNGDALGLEVAGRDQSRESATDDCNLTRHIPVVSAQAVKSGTISRPFPGHS